MSARERFFKKVQQHHASTPPGKKSTEGEIRAFCQRMDSLVQQINAWFEGSGIEVIIAKKYLYDLSTVGLSLNCGVCRYEITTIRLQNGNRSVSIIPEQLCRAGDRGCVTMNVDVPGTASGRQTFYLCMASDSGWFIRDEHQGAQGNVLLTEDVFFRAIENLA
ncbi:hypothetical protein [Enterobacter asburiae]|uniref:hypothetical protein n=1 Tax=Enterobacter asburiae TaxID=61645 RepID=UPI0011D201C2|nr:hypothetical protein [Enterobacter asburiae]